MIFTFYSYKGGVGRSMAMANIAEWLYIKKARVVLVDWDLEAPGIESFFYQEESDLEAVRSRMGVIELLGEYKDALVKSERLEPDLEPAARFDSVVSKLGPLISRLHVLHAPPNREAESPNGEAGLWLLTAGSRDEQSFSSYADRVQAFDWNEFYDDFQGERFFGWLRGELNEFDAAFIDSRTGVTEMGGVCTRELADVVVSLCAPNLQNLKGAVEMAKSFMRDEIRAARGEKPDVIIVPARVDLSELDDRNAFEDDFGKMVSRETVGESKRSLLPKVFQDLDRNFWDLRIPYIPKFAYREALTFASKDSKAKIQRAAELEEAYQRIASHLVMMTPPDSSLRSKISSEMEKFIGRISPLVVVSAMSDDDEAFASRLVSLLAERSVSVWQRIGTKGESLSWSRIESVVQGAGSLVLIVSPACLRNPLTIRQWRYAREIGVRVFLVRSDTFEAAAMPRSMREAVPLDIPAELESLAARLKAPSLPVKRPIMAPEAPLDYVPRATEEAALVRDLLAVRQTSVLYGPAGFGKTSLAAVVCRSDAVRDRFDDGILWVDASNGIDVLQVCSSLIQALDRSTAGYSGAGASPSWSAVEEALQQLRQTIGERECLLVMDGVESAESVRALLFGGLNCTRLVITSERKVVQDLSARCVVVDQMTVEEGAQLLSAGSESVRELVALLGRWLPALVVARRLLRRPGLFRDAAISESAALLAEVLKQHGLGAFDRRFDTNLTQIVQRRIGPTAVNPDGLPSLLPFAVFPPETPIPVAQFEKLAGRLDLKDEIEEWNAHQIIGYDAEARTIEVNALVHAYLADRFAETPVEIKRMKQQAGGSVPALVDWRFLEPVRVLEGIGHSAYVRAVIVTRDREAIISASDNGTIALSSGERWSESRVIATDPMPINALLTIQQDKQLISAGSDRTVRIRDVESGRLEREFKAHGHWVTSLAVFRHSLRIVSGSADRTIRLWDSHSGLIGTVRGQSGWITAVAPYEEGQVAFGSSDGTLTISDLETGKPIRLLTDHRSWIRALHAGDNGHLFSASSDGAVKIRSAKETIVELALEGVTCLAPLPYDLLAAGSSLGILRFWNWRKQELLEEIDVGAGVLCCAASPGGRLIAAGDARGRIHLLARKRL